MTDDLLYHLVAKR